VLKEYPRSLVVPEALWLLAEVNLRDGRDKEALELLRRLAEEYPYTDFSRRAGARLRAEVTAPCTTSSTSAPTRSGG
jgi:TolA-binding protein